MQGVAFFKAFTKKFLQHMEKHPCFYSQCSLIFILHNGMLWGIPRDLRIHLLAYVQLWVSIRWDISVFSLNFMYLRGCILVGILFYIKYDP